MAPKKKAVQDEAAQGGEAGNDARHSKTKKFRKAGFKDVRLLAATLAPHVTKRFSITYTTDRTMRSLDRKKLLAPSSCCRFSRLCLDFPVYSNVVSDSV